MILELNDITHFYGAELILSDICLRVEDRDRLGVVGYNGSGKTTLLNIITGELEPSSGDVLPRAGATFGYQRQSAELRSDNTVWEEMKTVDSADAVLARMKYLEQTMGTDSALLKEYEQLALRYDAIGGYEMDFRIKKVLSGLAVDPKSYDKKIAVLSGGERTRLAFAKLLISHPDLLILDEPTNHLDTGTLEWLEEFLSGYAGAVITVSHDRWFLDRVVTKVLEIVNHKAKLYRGNYTAFLRQREFQAEQAEKEYRRTSEEAEKLRDYAARNIVRASTTKMAQSRLKMLGRLDLSKPENIRHEALRFSITPQSEPYREVLILNDVSIRIKDRALAEHLSCTLMRGERLAVAGPNGAGKTTLLDVIAGARKPDSGKVQIGGGVKASYLRQNGYRTNAKNPLQYIWDRYPSMSQQEVRNLLAAVGFQGDEVFVAGSGLSGGELARLNLARISLEHPNFLILDEPTNHLDIYTKDILTAALKEYAGSMILVTHDRYLLSQLDAKILLFDGGNTFFFEDYPACRDYLDRGRSKPDLDGQTENEAAQESAPQAGAKEQRRIKARQRERISFLETEIERLEKKIGILEQETRQPETVSDHERLTDLFGQMEEMRTTLAEYGDEWLRLT